MVRKTILFILLIAIFFPFIPSATYAFGGDIDLDRTIPVANCGVPGIYTNPLAARCCYYAPIKSIDKVPWIIEKMSGFIGFIPLIPNPFKAWNTARESILETQDKYASAMPCFAGVPKPDGVSPSDPSCRCEVKADTVRETIVAMCRNRFDVDKRGSNTNLSANEVSRINKERDNCIRCGSDNGYYSAIGCVRFSLNDFLTKWVFGLGVSFAGLFALGCIILAAIRIQLSQGQAESIQQSRESLTSCILGLLLIIFSVFILNLVGVAILPGLFFM
jgi:ribosomal protein S14